MAKTASAKARKKSTSTRKSSQNAKRTKKAAAASDTAVPSASAQEAQSAQDAQVDRRGDDRRAVDRRQNDEPVAVERRQLQRREKVNRRRQIDPTTCERDYTDAEIEFMNALDEYKRTSGRMFPTCSEILEVIISLGYQKIQHAEPKTVSAFDTPANEELAPSAREEASGAATPLEAAATADALN